MSERFISLHPQVLATEEMTTFRLHQSGIIFDNTQQTSINVILLIIDYKRNTLLWKLVNNNVVYNDTGVKSLTENNHLTISCSM